MILKKRQMWSGNVWQFNFTAYVTTCKWLSKIKRHHNIAYASWPTQISKFETKS